jgi:hypothetical protein
MPEVTRTNERRPDRLRYAVEEIVLFNPAFVALLYVRTVQGWTSETGEDGVPFHFAHLAVAMTLHTPTRRAIPDRMNANFVDWIQRNPEVAARLPKSAQALGPLLRGGLLFALSSDVCRWRPPNVLMIDRGAKSIRGESEEVIACQRAARFLGRWLPKSGSAASIFGLLKVRP